jgi:hypothetical protein
MEDYYEQFMKLITCLQIAMNEGFILSNFRTGFLDYLRVTTGVLNIASLIDLKEAAQKYDNNCIDASGQKVKLNIQKIVPSLLRLGSTSQKEPKANTNKRPYLSKCQKYGHEEVRCWGKPPNS